MSDKKVYMILTNGFDPDVRVYKEAKYLVSKGYDVEILCWDRRCEYIDKQEEIIDGIKAKRFCIKSKLETGMKQIIPYIKFMITIKNYIKKHNYSYIHCHDFDGAIAGLYINHRKKAIMVFDMHEIYNAYSYAKFKIFKHIFNHVVKKSNYIVYVNDEQIKDIKNEKKLVYLPNYPLKETYEPIKKEDNNGILRINYIGSVRDVESLLVLNDVENKYDVGVYGIGSGYEKLIESIKDHKKLSIYGKYDGLKDSSNIYRHTDVLYCVYNPNVFNWKKALPIKLFEAIVTQTPIIVAKDTEVEKIVNNYRIGEAVTYGNLNELNNAIEKIEKNYFEYVTQLKQISNNYCWEEQVKELDTIYE